MLPDLNLIEAMLSDLNLTEATTIRVPVTFCLTDVYRLTYVPLYRMRHLRRTDWDPVTISLLSNVLSVLVGLTIRPPEDLPTLDQILNVPKEARPELRKQRVRGRRLDQYQHSKWEDVRNNLQMLLERECWSSFETSHLRLFLALFAALVALPRRP